MVTDEDGMPLEQMRDELKEPEPVLEQSGIQTRRSSRKRKAPTDDEVSSILIKKIHLVYLFY